MAPPTTTPGARGALEELTQALRRFAQERDWRQFHSPKNLACALSVEAAELLEHFQWLTEAQSDDLSGDKRAAVGSEMADVLLYLLQLADRLQIDLAAAAREKLALNERRYPVERSRGSSRKYDEPPQDR
jgi:dCTP diphosphatase